MMSTSGISSIAVHPKENTAGELRKKALAGGTYVAFRVYGFFSTMLLPNMKPISATARN
jgi:hypothetical protein